MDIRELDLLRAISEETHINFEQIAWAVLDHDTLREVISDSGLKEARDWFTYLPSCSGLRNLALRRWESFITQFDDACEMIEFTHCCDAEVQKIALQCYLKTAKTIPELKQVIVEAKDFPLVKRDALRKLVDVYCSEHSNR